MHKKKYYYLPFGVDTCILCNESIQWDTHWLMTLCFVHARFSWNNRKNVCRIFIYFSLVLLILSTCWHIIFIIGWKRRNYSKSSIFFALVFLNVSWLSSDHITYKNIMFWAKVHYSMKIKKREKMSIINIIMLSLFRKCLVALLRVFVVFLIFSLWFKVNSSNILNAGLFLWYFFGSFFYTFSPI